MTILITESSNYSSLAVRLYQKIGPVWFDHPPEGNDHLVRVLVVRLSVILDAVCLSRYPNLQAIVTPTTGLTHINLDFCKEHGIEVFSLGRCKELIEKITSTSELTLGLIIALLRGIPRANSSVVNKREWKRDAFRSRQLSHLTLGVVGLGRIGGHVALYGHALGMHVQASDPHQPDERFKKLNVEKLTMAELLVSSDILTIHANLTQNNHKLIGEEEIRLLPSHALVINTARGQLLDEGALADALRQGRVAGVAVDVLSEEHMPILIAESPLVRAARDGLNIIITPHIGGCTSDAMHLTEENMAEVYVNYFNELS